MGRPYRFMVMYCKLYLQEVTKNDDDMNKIRHELLQGKTVGKEYAIEHNFNSEDFADCLYDLLINGNKKEYTLSQEELKCLNLN